MVYELCHLSERLLEFPINFVEFIIHKLKMLMPKASYGRLNVTLISKINDIIAWHLLVG